MRSAVTSLLAAVFVLVMALPALAQYPPVNPGDDAASSLGCTVTTETTSCSVGGLEPGSSFSITLTFQSSSAARVVLAARTFAVAQASNSITLSGTADADGIGRASGPTPAGVDPNAPVQATLTGTAAGGEPIVVNTVVNQPAAAPDTGDTVPATGANSGVLALVAVALLAVGAAAVLLTRRKPPVHTP